MAGPGTLKIAVVEGPDAPITVTFQGPRLLIGRSGSCDLVLADSQISRRHAAIECEDTDFVLLDLGSANGTRVGPVGQRVKRHVLREGDVVRLGHNLLKVTLLRDADAAELKPTPTAGSNEVTAVSEVSAGRLSITFTVVLGPDKGAAYSSAKDRLKIGRQTSCDVRLSDPAVSRVHATVKREPSGYAIYDENSSNGIEIGTPPQRVPFAKLEPGSVVRLGSTELRVAIGGARFETLPVARAPSRQPPS
jgi:pSer/pThr/pTyr-binding forkhead associated (FHA) protein